MSKLKRITVQHGLSGHPLYKRWRAMNARCSNKNSINYSRYGLKGIKVCEEWRGVPDGFLKFLEDMGPMPVGGTVDRIDNNKGYSPDNCRWEDIYVQANNKSTNVYFTAYGVTARLLDWAEALEIPKSRLYKRKRWGWTDHECLFIPRAQRVDYYEQAR